MFEMSENVETALSYGALGTFVGVGYYMAHVLNVHFTPPEGMRWVLWVLEGGRVLAAIGFFAWLASLGSIYVLSAFVGFLLGRTVAFRIAGGD